MKPRILLTSLRFAYDNTYRNNAIDKLCDALEVDKTGPEMCGVSEVMFTGFGKISVKGSEGDFATWSDDDINWFIQQVETKLPKSAFQYEVLDDVMNKLAVKLLTGKTEVPTGYPKWFIASYIKPVWHELNSVSNKPIVK